MTIKRNRKWGMWGFVVFLGSMILILSISDLIMKTIIEILMSNEVTTTILLFTMSNLAFMVIYQSYTQIRHIRLMEKFRKL